MKKVITLLLALVLVFSVVGCSGAPAQETNTAKPIETESPTVEPTPTEVASSWEIDYFVDDFGDDTDDAYAVGSFSGKFSNTATSGSDLLVYVYLMPESTGKSIYNSWGHMISFRLCEYGKTAATYSKNDLINLSIKIDDTVYSVECMGIAPNGDVYLTPHYSYEDDALSSCNNSDREEVYGAFITALRDKKTISCSITIGDLGNITSGVGGSQYKFKIDGNGFAEQEAIVMNGIE